MLEGRVKTLHPGVHGGISPFATCGACRHDDAHNIAPIGLLVVNLYPFEEAVERRRRFGDCIENIDIGGPAMIRAAAKNHADVTVVIEPRDYTRCSMSSRGSAA